MFELSSSAFLIPKNIALLKSYPYMININKKYIISEEDELKLLSVITHSILFSNEIKKQTSVCVKGLMAVLDLFKLHNIFVDDKDIKQANYKTSFIVENMFKYILESISTVSSAPDIASADTASVDTAPNTAADTAPADITLKCTIARIFYNKKKMLFFILLLIIGVENYEKIGYTFKTGGGGDNCHNFANKLYKLMHEFFFDSIPSKILNKVGRPSNKRKIGRPSNKHKLGRSSNKRKVEDDSEEYIAPTKRNCNRDNTITTRQTRGCIIVDNITEIFKYDSEIFHYSLLQNGKDLSFSSNIFEL